MTDTDYTDRLRLIAVNDRLLTAELWGGTGAESDELDPKTRALAQLAALVAVGGPTSSYGALADAAVNTGASPAEMVEVLVSVAPLVGLPRSAAAAAALAMALGCDIDNGLDS